MNVNNGENVNGNANTIGNPQLAGITNEMVNPMVVANQPNPITNPPEHQVNKHAHIVTNTF